MSDNREERTGIWRYFDEIDTQFEAELRSALPEGDVRSAIFGELELWLFDELSDEAPNSIAAFLHNEFPNNPETLANAYKYFVETMNLYLREGIVLTEFQKFFLAQLRRIPGVVSDREPRAMIENTKIAELLLPLILAHVPAIDARVTYTSLQKITSTGPNYLNEFFERNYDDLDYLNVAGSLQEFNYTLGQDFYMYFLRDYVAGNQMDISAKVQKK